MASDAKRIKTERIAVDLRELRREMRKSFRDYQKANADDQLVLAVRNYESTLGTAISLAGLLESEWYPKPKVRTKPGPKPLFTAKDLRQIIDAHKCIMAKDSGRAIKDIRDTEALRHLFDGAYLMAGLTTYRWRPKENYYRKLLSQGKKLITKS